MLKRRYVKRAYIEEAICDKCGSPMQHTGVVLTSYPAQYPYVCTNKECNYKISYLDYERPGILKYEFEEK